MVSMVERSNDQWVARSIPQPRTDPVTPTAPGRVQAITSSMPREGATMGRTGRAAAGRRRPRSTSDGAVRFRVKDLEDFVDGLDESPPAEPESDGRAGFRGTG